MKPKVLFAIIFLSALAITFFGYTQKQIPEAAAKCNELLANDWNEGALCVINIGANIQNIGECDGLNNLESPEGQLTDFKSLCMWKFAANMKDASLCSKISSLSDKETNAYRNSCIVEIAAANKDQSICSLVIAESADIGKGTTEESNKAAEEAKAIYNVCMSNAAKNEDECMSIKDEKVISRCISLSAQRNKDEDICKKIKDSSERNSCIWEIAIFKKDWTVCNKIVESEYGHRDYCVKQVAYDILDDSICDNAGALKNECVSSIEQYKEVMCKSCDPSTGVICPERCNEITAK